MSSNVIESQQFVLCPAASAKKSSVVLLVEVENGLHGRKYGFAKGDR